MTLRELLERRTPSWTERTQRDCVLSSPWCWPFDPDLTRMAEQFASPPPPPPIAGEVCLVSVADGRGSLWRLIPNDDGMAWPDRRPLVGEALAAADRAHVIAGRELPAAPVLPRDRPKWWAAPITFWSGEQRVLDGDSYGLSLCLAAASRLLQLPVGSHVVALATVAADGQLGPVEIDAKLRVILDWGLGIHKVIVSQRQEEHARSIVGATSGVEVVGCAALSHVMDHVFPGAQERALMQWTERGAIRQAASRFYRLALRDEAGWLGWRGVAVTCSALVDKADAPLERWKFNAALAIARRHLGEPAELPFPDGDPNFAELPRPLRLWHLAHVVQTASDAVLPEIDAVLTRSRRHVADVAERHPEDLVLLGSIGRAEAAALRYDDALATLWETVTGWSDLFEPARSSHSLCELLRVSGLLRSTTDVARAQSHPLRAALEEPSLSEISRCFLGVATGRALVQIDRPGDALVMLQDASAPWFAAPHHLTCARLRWMGRALVMTGALEEGMRVRTELETLSGSLPKPDSNAALAELDRALEDGLDPSGPLARLRALRGRDVARLVGSDDSLDAARRVAEEWRY